VKYTNKLRAQHTETLTLILVSS